MAEHISQPDLVVIPRWQDLGTSRVTADIHQDQPSRFWSVTIIFSREPGLEPIQGQNVHVELLDDQGTALRIMKQPSGPLFETAEALRISADAPFQFQDSGHALDQLVVTYQEHSARFRIAPQSSSEPSTAQ